MENPVPFLYAIFLLGPLVHYPAQLARFLIFLVQIHCFWICAFDYIRILRSKSNQYFLLLLWSQTSHFAFFLNDLLMPDNFCVCWRYSKRILDHHIRVMVIEQSKWILAPCFGVYFKTIENKLSKSKNVYLQWFRLFVFNFAISISFLAFKEFGTELVYMYLNLFHLILSLFVYSLFILYILGGSHWIL